MSLQPAPETVGARSGLPSQQNESKPVVAVTVRKRLSDQGAFEDSRDAYLSILRQEDGVLVISNISYLPL